MKKTSTKNGVQHKSRPALKWQTGDYERHAEFKFDLPCQFLLLCRLVDKTPPDIIKDFTDNLSCGSWKRAGRDQAKEHLVNYFIAHGYGQHHYSEEEILQMFKEMDALGSLFPTNGKMKLIDLYANWRDKHNIYFLKNGLKSPGVSYPKKGRCKMSCYHAKEYLQINRAPQSARKYLFANCAGEIK